MTTITLQPLGYEFINVIKRLTRLEKFQLVQFLVMELAQDNSL